MTPGAADWPEGSDPSQVISGELTGPMIVWFPKAQSEEDLTEAERAIAQTADQVHYGSDAPDFTPPEL